MKLRGSVSMSVACLCVFVGAATPPAAADEVIILEPGYVITSPVSLPGYTIYTGTSLQVVGHVQEFVGPFADLNHRPHPEFTYVLSGFVCTEEYFWDDFINDIGGWLAEFTDGELSIYRDISTTARFDDPRTFSDGEELFEAVCSNFLLGWIPNAPLPGLVFTGGSLFDRVSANGTGYRGIVAGELDEGTIPADMLALGYRAVYTGTVQVSFPVPVQSTTWGRLKTLYDH